MPVAFDRVYLEAVSRYLPGPPVDNTRIDEFIAPLNRLSGRIKKRILAENGIQTRHYAIAPDGTTTESHAQLAAHAVRSCLAQAQHSLTEVSLLAVGSSGGDALMPGFASMIQGELAAPPMSTLSCQGICIAGVQALLHAAQGVQLGAHHTALAVAAEMPSRLFKKSRYEPQGYNADFDAHFLRWMLSDGAGAALLTSTPSGRNGLRLALKWVHQQSFAGDYPVCMQLGLTPDRSRSFLDFASSGAAEAAGALALRQDVRLLPHLFDVSIHEYLKLVHEGWLRADEVDHFLCHYSSAKFIPIIETLLDQAGLGIPRQRWYSNLASCGNTGAASIFIMLSQFLETQSLKAGEKILCFIPESGRISAAFMLIEVQSAPSPNPSPTPSPNPRHARQQMQTQPEPDVPPPHDPRTGKPALQPLLTQLATTWQDYRSRFWRSPLVRKLSAGDFSVSDYQRWTAQWVPQVRQGSLWMREGAAALTGPYAPLKDLIEVHASDEQNDFLILYQDYVAAGGSQTLDSLKRNPGGEALNTYLHALAATENPVGLLGAIYIIEGTGQRIIPALLPLIKQALNLPPSAYRFLEYHAGNDEHHLARWLTAVESVLAINPHAQLAITNTARRTAQLYLMQLEHILED